jgi:hypothetical protein
VKHLVLFTSALLALCISTAACSTTARSRSVADTAKPARRVEFIDNITIGEDKKKGKRAASPTDKLAALTPDEEHMIRDLPRKRAATKAIGIELSAPLQFKYAILLDMPVEVINDEKLLELIESWYGTKYKFGGNTRSGVDQRSGRGVFFQKICRRRKSGIGKASC